MKLNGKDRNRELRVGDKNEDGYRVLIERVRYTRVGYSQASWDEQRITLTDQEIKALYQATLGVVRAKP